MREVVNYTRPWSVVTTAGDELHRPRGSRIANVATPSLQNSRRIDRDRERRRRGREDRQDGGRKTFARLWDKTKFTQSRSVRTANKEISVRPSGWEEGFHGPEGGRAMRGKRVREFRETIGES